MNRIPRVVVAGLRGGSGKTTLSVGITAAAARRGIRVVPFKKGPDYIDAGWLSLAAGNPCYNLDPFLIGQDALLESFAKNSQEAGLAVIEGNRGLFDGRDAHGTYSTSRVATLLKAPVILIVDCTKTTRTTAAVVHGAKTFERGLRIGGVVLNKVGGARHERVTREAVETYAGVPVLGAIPRLKEAELPERHMGLTTWQEHAASGEAIALAAAIIEKYVDLDRVLEVAASAPALKGHPKGRASVGKGKAGPYVVTKPLQKPDARGGAGHVSLVEAGQSDGGGSPAIGILKDSAFQFYYPENIEALREAGARVVEISALSARELPPELDALYIGGGFPETHAIELARNKRFRNSLLKAVRAGLPVYAECGGLMYLGRSIVLGRRTYPMAGVFPISFTLHEKPVAHGYTTVKVTRKNPFFKSGTELNGHEFHYSLPVFEGDAGSLAFTVKRGVGIIDGRDGICSGNVLATYTHIHALGAPDWAPGMVRAAMAYSRRRRA